MNIILFTKYIGSPLTLRAARSKYNLFFYTLIGLVGASIFYAGFWLGQANKMNLAGASIFKSHGDYIRELKEKIAKAKQDAKTDLRALAHNLDELKRHMYRLDNLGKRLVVASGMSSDAYTFAQRPKTNYRIRLIKGLDGIEAFYAKLERMDIELTRGLAKRTGTDPAAPLVSDTHLPRHVPSGKPIKMGRMSSGFGVRKHPVTGQHRFHQGVDFAARRGSPIYAVADGLVTKAKWHRSYGYMIEIDHGQFKTRYAHNARNLVKKGQRVWRGQKIALVGRSGQATGAHVHFEVLNSYGMNTDPHPFIKQHILYQSRR